jgi:hypothetical protein
MRRFLRIVGGFAIAGFTLPWLMLVFYGIAQRVGEHPSPTPLVILCPASIAALGLDSASLLVGLLGWVAIAISNALLYAVVGAVISIPLVVARRAPARHQVLGLIDSASANEPRAEGDAPTRL